jgi:hypothetical protein
MDADRRQAEARHAETDVLRSAEAELESSTCVLARAEWVSIKNYARLNDVHRNTVTKWIAAGLVTIYRVRRIVRVRNIPPKSTDGCTPTHIG